MIGWIRLSRKILDGWLWKETPFSKAQAWIDLLLLASHEKKKFLLGNELMEVERGSFITSETKLMKRWGWGKGKTRAFLSLLESDDMIIKDSDHKRTTITIVNYDKYQNAQTTDGLIADRERTDSGLIADSINNNNNNNKNNNKRERAFAPPSVQDVREYCQERKNNIDPEVFVDFYASKGWKVGKNPMKDWKACVRTWEKRKQDDKGTKQKPVNKFVNFEERQHDSDYYKNLENLMRRN